MNCDHLGYNTSDYDATDIYPDPTDRPTRADLADTPHVLRSTTPRTGPVEAAYPGDPWAMTMDEVWAMVAARDAAAAGETAPALRNAA